MYNYINNFYLYIYLLRTLQEELQTTENRKQNAIIAYKSIEKKRELTSSELNSVSTQVRKLRSVQSECTDLINELKDKMEASKATSADVFVSKMYLESHFEAISI